MSQIPQVRVRAIQKKLDKKNPVSGHEWTEYGPITGYEVVGPLGVWSKHKSEKAAIKAAKDLEAYYQKYPINYGG